MLITPEQAAAWLKNIAPTQRPLKASHVGYFLYAMREGYWLPADSSPITFDDEGRLVNGQHRLTALVQYGHPLNIPVEGKTPDV